ncbi:MAG: ParB/RepB/Spo0J family partition protein, partial [Syntrophorhabdaceae bacterium]|nr:ParB/RepB/Spo0J family partition protein [Syntrophorhabdaceae bacterium]
MYNKKYFFEILPVNKISVNDRSYCISYPLYDEMLTISIKEMGVIQPIIVKEQFPFIVISGHKRLNSVLYLGMEDIPCIILDVNPIEACNISINENLFRELNIVEKAHCINMMVHSGFSMLEIFGIMERFNLGRHENIVKKMMIIANCEDILKDYIASRNMSIKSIDYLLWFEVKERERLINSLSKIHLTESLLRGILQMLILVKLKTEDLPWEALDACDNPYELRKILKTYVNPHITKMEHEFKTLKNSLKLPKNIDIMIDPFFEKEYIDIMIRAKEK